MLILKCMFTLESRVRCSGREVNLTDKQKLSLYCTVLNCRPTEDYGRRLLPLCPHLCIF